jgi:UDP-glucose 4-epimerase
MNLRDPYRGVIAIFISQLLKDQAISLYGDGTHERAFTYVEDILPALERAGFDENIQSQVLSRTKILLLLGSNEP